jgi:hypothetical protein
MIRRFVSIGVVLILPLSVWGQQKEQDQPSNCRRYDSSTNVTKSAPCNGISIGEPKVFDNRTLTLMLESLSQTLSAQQQSYIDQKSVLAALANIQGFTQSETATNLSITGSPTPATDVKTTLNTGNVSSSGASLPNTTSRTTDTSKAAVTPQSPSLDTLPAFQGFNPTYGSSASDLLNDQVNLTYQIFNLRMILERALSDRLLPAATLEPDNRTRLQAVLGFNVTIDPPRTANDAVAVVEITVERQKEDSGSGVARQMSLVALMPQEKTYNAAALSSKSNAFAGSAMVSAFQVGFSARKRGQIFYLFRDNDTLSYERMTGDPNRVVFGWMFRPVLGRRSVSPGLRQMFGILALPDVDCASLKTEKCTAPLATRVRTYWKKYDRGTLTSFVREDANRAHEFWYALSLGLAKPQIFPRQGYENDADYSMVVEPSTKYSEALKPQVNSVEWRPVGAKNVIVSVRGNNFFTGTQLAIGDKIYAKPEDGLILKSNQGFDLITSMDALVNGPGTLIGRYDVGQPLIQTSPLPPGFSSNGVRILEALTHPAMGGNRRLEIHIQGIPAPGELKSEEDAQQALDQAQIALRTAQQNLARLNNAEAEVERAKNQGKAALQQAQKSLNDIVGQLGNRSTLEAAVKDAEAAINAKQKDVDKAHSQIKESWHSSGLKNLLRFPPVISVNGKALEMPYYAVEVKGKNYWSLEADLSDSTLVNGAGVAKVSWPFFPAELWTKSVDLHDPDQAFPVTRVSQKTIVISRIDGFNFVNGPEVPGQGSRCWHLIAGDTQIDLQTSACDAKKSGGVTPNPVVSTPTITTTPSQPAPRTKSANKKTATPATAQDKGEAQTPSPPPLPPPSDFVVIATLASLPDKVELVAPSGSTYTLTIPGLNAKPTSVQPLALKQYDSLWIEVKAGDLSTGSTAKPGDTGPDLSTVTVVEANGKPLNSISQADSSVANAGAATSQKPKVTSIKVEITRDLTAKPGTIDIGFHAGAKLIGTRQIQIARTEWGSQGDK